MYASPHLSRRRHGVVDPLRGAASSVNGTSSSRYRRGRAQPPRVPLVQKRHAVVGAQRLVDALAVEEPVIVDGDDGVLGPCDLPVDVNRAADGHSCTFVMSIGGAETSEISFTTELTEKTEKKQHWFSLLAPRDSVVKIVCCLRPLRSLLSLTKSSTRQYARLRCACSTLSRCARPIAARSTRSASRRSC